MTTDPLALVAAMPMPEPSLMSRDTYTGEEVWAFDSDDISSERLKAAQLVLAQGEPKRNDPISALAIRFLVAAGHVTQAKADEAFTLACGAVEAEARRLNTTLPWVVRAPAAPVNAEVLAAAKDVASHMVGELPVRGWLRDNDASRSALGRLAAAIASAEAAEGKK